MRQRSQPLPAKMEAAKTLQGDRVLLRKESLHQHTPGVAVFHRVAGDLGDSFFDIAMDADNVAVRKSVRERNFRLDELVTIEQTEFVRNGRQVCELIAACMNIRPKAG